MVKRVTISVDEETHERLRQYAFEHRTTVSAAVKQWIWSEKVKYDNVRGQIKLGGK